MHNGRLSRLRKGIIIFICMLLLMALMPKNALAETYGEALQDVIDSVEPGGTLWLDGVYLGYYQGTDTETVTISKPITITAASPTTINYIHFEVQADNVTIQNLSMWGAYNTHGSYINASNVKNFMLDNCHFLYGSDVLASSQGGCVMLASANSAVIRNCTFSGGRASIYGGAMTCSGCNDLQIEGCAFADNMAKAPTGSGGALYCLNSRNIIVSNTVFSENQTKYYGAGAAFSMCEDINITDCRFDGNSGVVSKDNKEWMGAGGALAFTCNAKDITVSNTDFYDNKGYYGGALYADRTDNLAINDCRFQDNDVKTYCTINEDALNFMADMLAYILTLDVASVCEQLFSYVLTEAITPGVQFGEGINRVGGDGGAVYSIKSDMQINNCDFFGNTAKKNGGGVYLAGSTKSPRSEINASYFYNNSSGNTGGAVANYSDNHHISGCLINSNESEAGGGVYNAGFADIANTQFNSNTAYTGGAVCVNLEQGEYQIADCEFDSNTAVNGGAVRAHGNLDNSTSKDLTIEQSTFNQNHANEYGGALSFYYAFGDITGSEFTENAAAGIGGAVYTETGGKFDISDCLFQKNEALYAGAAFLSSSWNIEDSRFLGNNADLYAGAVYIADCTYDSIIEDTLFRNNTSVTGTGALCLKNPSGYQIHDCRFKNNSSENAAGAITVKGWNDYRNEVYIQRTHFAQNQSFTDAGAINCGGTSEAYVLSCLFTKNKTTEGAAAGSVLVATDNAQTNLTGCTLVDNYTDASASRNGMYTIYGKKTAKVTLINNILLSNTVMENVGEDDIKITGSAVLNARSNICALTGNGNMAENTGVFVDYGSENYHLNYDFFWGTPGAVDQGVDTDYLPWVDWVYNAPTIAYDLDGEIRRIDADGDGNKQPDLGAYECQYVKVTAHAALPGETPRGTLTDETVWVSLDSHNVIDTSAFGLTVDDGWEVKKWTLENGADIAHMHGLTSGVHIYANYRRIPIPVIFVFDNTKLRIAEAPRGNLNEVSPGHSEFTTRVGKYLAPNYPEMTGIDGWEFAGWDIMPASVTEAVTITATYRPTAIYKFGEHGYYTASGEQLRTWVTNLTNPLNSPQPGKITTHDHYEFVGWSLTEGGTPEAFPVSVAEPTVFYAVYQQREYNLTIDINGGSYESGHADASGTYPYATVFNLTDMGVVVPPGQAAILRVTDQNGENVCINSFVLRNNTTLTYHYTDTVEPLTRPRMCILTVEPTAGGAVEQTSLLYREGTDVNMNDIAVYPQTGFAFVGWRDAQGGDANTFTITQNTTVYAVFTPTMYYLHWMFSANQMLSTKSASIPEANEFESDIEYPHGTTVWLTEDMALIPAGSEFIGFEDEDGKSVSAVLMDKVRTVSAVYEPVNYIIYLRDGSNGRIEEKTYICQYGNTIDLSAEACDPDEGFVFSYWENEAGEEVALSYQVTMDQVLTPVFKKKPVITHNLTVKALDNGSVLPGLGGDYTEGESVFLDSSYAAANDGYQFAGYHLEGDDSIVSSVTMNADITVLAVFIPVKHCLTIKKIVNDEVIGQYPARWYNEGETVLTNLLPNDSDDVFIGWFDLEMKSIESVKMDTDAIIYALFETKGGSETGSIPTPTPEPTATLEPTAPPESSATPVSGGTVQLPEREESHEPEKTVGAADVVKQIKEPQGLLWYWWVVIGLGALLLAGGFIVMLIRRKS